ncbi:MAG: hypothetical protein CL840_01505 [Crocinitomicaceae bacterium]|nr:hypothetical protein [Crocinitomicaceae bacterium]|tara:strand:+ start:1072 stop:2103 length:1032 start_codon:yes stop_codon:yes gene_type:complete
MYVRKNISWISLLKFTWIHIVWLTVWGTFAVSLYVHFNLHWVSIPWLPVSVIGIAVSFFVGFKTDSSYDRLWEARKIWGAIVNTSRMWGSSVKNFVNDLDAEKKVDKDELKSIQRNLIRKHIAWLYVLRAQLLRPEGWEHSQIKRGVGWINNRRQARIKKLFGHDDIIEILKQFDLTEEQIKNRRANAATQLLDINSGELLKLRKRGLISDYRHVQLQNLLNNQYAEQGKCERIKKFPFPRQYATGSIYFIGIFIFLLPFGMVTEFEKLAEELIWLTVPFVTLVGWVFVLMELIGDYSENPFEGLPNDVPMLSICRTIEIDLLEMINEENIPKPIQPQEGLMM